MFAGGRRAPPSAIVLNTGLPRVTGPTCNDAPRNNPAYVSTITIVTRISVMIMATAMHGRHHNLVSTMIIIHQHPYTTILYRHSLSPYIIILVYCHHHHHIDSIHYIMSPP